MVAYLAGAVAGKAMHRAHYMNERSLLPFSVALALVLLAGLSVLNMNPIIGAVVGGLGFANQISKNEDLQEERVQESIERIFIIPLFFIFGTMLPWEEWIVLRWKAIGIVVAVLFFRRIPAFLLLIPLLKPFRRNYSQAALMGWFGPMGVAALYYAIHATERTGVNEAWVIPSLIVFASTLVHGISSVPVERWFHEKGEK